jgi:hypothetical protein
MGGCWGEEFKEFKEFEEFEEFEEFKERSQEGFRALAEDLWVAGLAGGLVKKAI